MGMSESERGLLVTGTLDTSGVGGSPFEELDQVALAFGAQAAESEPEVAEKEPLAEPEVVEAPKPAKAEEKPAPRKRASAKKTQAPTSADK